MLKQMGDEATQIAYADSLDDDFSLKNKEIDFFSDEVIFMGLIGLGIGVILTVIVIFIIKKKKINES